MRSREQELSPQQMVQMLFAQRGYRYAVGDRVPVKWGVLLLEATVQDFGFWTFAGKESVPVIYLKRPPGPLPEDFIIPLQQAATFLDKNIPSNETLQ